MIQYTVRPNESPSSIARKHGVSVSALMNANRHKPIAAVGGRHTWQSLRHGEKLNVPTTRTGMIGDDPSQMAAVTATKLNIRASPFADATITGGNSNGDFVSVINWNGAPADSTAPQGWAEVSSPMGLDASGNPGRTSPAYGFMSKQYLVLQPTLAPATPISSTPPAIPGLPNLPIPIPANFIPGLNIPGLTTPASPLPPPAPPSPAAAGQALAAILNSSGCAGCGDTSSPLSTATYAFKKSSLNDPNCVGMACGNIYGSTYNTQGAAMYAYGPGTQTALSKAIGSTARAACTDSNGTCLGGPSPAPTPVLPTIPGLPAIFPVTPPASGGQTATITATKLNIRATPSATGAVVGGNSSGDTVNVLNWNGAPADSSAPSGWAQVSSPAGLDVAGNPGRTSSVTGYMSKQYLSLSAAPAPTPAPQVATTCPPGQMYIPILGCQPIPGLPPVTPATPATPTTPPVQPASLNTTCPPGQTYIPLVGCMPNLLPPPPAPGPSPAPSPTPTIISCPAGQVLNPLTGKCWTIPPLVNPFPVNPAPQPQPQPQPGPNIQPQPPTPPATTKAGLSTGTMVAAGLGVAALVGVIAYAATRKKTGHAGKRGKTGHKGKPAKKTKKKK